MEWISVKDKLPPKDDSFKRCSKNVLCYFSPSTEQAVCFFETEKKVFYNYTTMNEVDEVVTFWMPLPKDPITQEVSDDDFDPMDRAIGGFGEI